MRNPESTKKSWTPTQPDSTHTVHSLSKSVPCPTKMLRLWKSTTTIATPRTVSSAGTWTFDSGRCVASPSFGELSDRVAHRGHALEDASLEHVVGELDVELAFEREHHVDARVRGHARLV